MFKSIKKFFKAPSQVKKLQEELLLSRKNSEEFRVKYQVERERQSDARQVVEKIFGRGVKYFDYNELSPDGLRKYYKDARFILDCEVFNNIFNQIIATQTMEQVRQYNPVTNLILPTACRC